MSTPQRHSLGLKRPLTGFFTFRMCTMLNFRQLNVEQVLRILEFIQMTYIRLTVYSVQLLFIWKLYGRRLCMRNTIISIVGRLPTGPVKLINHYPIKTY